MSNKYYETPSTRVIETHHEGIICASEIKGSSSIQKWSDGGTTNEEIYM